MIQFEDIENHQQIAKRAFSKAGQTNLDEDWQMYNSLINELWCLIEKFGLARYIRKKKINSIFPSTSPPASRSSSAASLPAR